MYSVHATKSETYRRLFGQQLTDSPKRFPTEERAGRSQTLGWVFVSQDCKTMKACRTYQTLFVMEEQFVYYTPNTFYRNDRREEAALRWLNAVVIDVDVKGEGNPNQGMCLIDLLDRIDCAGLPRPSMVVQTPSGGFHVYFMLDTPRKAYTNAIQTYKKLQLAIASSIGGDRQAIGAERWFRLPTPETIVYRSENCVSFAELLTWREINTSVTTQVIRESTSIVRKGLLDHPAVRTLLEGVESGKRDNTCYTLALTYKREGYSFEDTESELQDWNSRLEEPLSQRIVTQKVRSAYKEGAPSGPTAEWITYLSGVSFTYQVWEAAKPRNERKSSHFDEWADDVIKTLLQLPGHQFTDSQRKLAAYWGMSLSSFQHVVALLINTGKIIVEVKGIGRKATTTLRLAVPQKPIQQRAMKSCVLNVPNSNTYLLDAVVGGAAARLPGLLLLPRYSGPP